MEKLKDYHWFIASWVSVFFIAAGYRYFICYFDIFNLDVRSYLDLPEVIQLLFTEFSQTAVIITLLLTMAWYAGILLYPWFIKVSSRVEQAFKLRRQAKQPALEETSLSSLPNYRRWAATEKSPLKEILTLNIKNFSRLLLPLTVLWLFGKVKTFSQMEAESLLAGLSKYEVKVALPERTLQTDKNFILIGQTKNYLFFYDRLSKTSSAYKTSDVEEITSGPGLDHRQELSTRAGTETNGVRTK